MKVLTTDEELKRLLFASELGSLGTVVFNAMGLDYLGVYEGIVKLEELYGPLPIFHIPDYYPDDHRKELIIFRLKEQLNLKRLFSEMKDIATISKPPHVLIELLLKPFKPSFDDQVKTYLAYFELIYENFVGSLCETASKSPLKGYNRQIDFIRTLLNQYTECKRLSFMFDGLSGTLRNALVHSNYYAKEGILHYFQDNPWKKKVKFFEKSLIEFEKEIGRLFIQRWIFNIISGLRWRKLSLQELK